MLRHKYGLWFLVNSEMFTRAISDTFHLSENNMVSPLFSATCLNGCFIRMVNMDFKGDNKKTPCLGGAVSTWVSVSSPTSYQFGDGAKKGWFPEVSEQWREQRDQFNTKNLEKEHGTSKSHKIRAIWGNGVCAMHLLKSKAFFLFFIVLIIKQHLFATIQHSGRLLLLPSGVTISISKRPSLLFFCSSF